MKKQIIRLFAAFAVFAAGFSTVSCQSKLPQEKLTIIKQDSSEVSVKAEMALTPETRQKGYMFRRNIPDGTGMLFVFENDQVLRFWMKNTPHALSIAYINSDGKIRDIYDMEPFSLGDVVSTGYCRYALEVPQGWFKKQNIKRGDYLKLDFKTK